METKEKISRARILSYRGQEYDILDVPKKVSPIEGMILSARCSGDSFMDLKKESVSELTEFLIERASGILGVEVSDNKFLTDELSNFILHYGYGELAYNELLLALRLHARHNLTMPTGVDINEIQFNGKYFSIFYYSEVLKNYMILRNNFDRKIQNQIDGY